MTENKSMILEQSNDRIKMRIEGDIISTTDFYELAERAGIKYVWTQFYVYSFIKIYGRAYCTLERKTEGGDKWN